jgi:hypothetical protein
MRELRVQASAKQALYQNGFPGTSGARGVTKRSLGPLGSYCLSCVVVVVAPLGFIVYLFITKVVAPKI